jgi:hypothetical protein
MDALLDWFEKHSVWLEKHWLAKNAVIIFCTTGAWFYTAALKVWCFGTGASR